MAVAIVVALMAEWATASDPRSVIFSKPIVESQLDTIVIESARDPDHRPKKTKPPMQRFREALEGGTKTSGLAAFDHAGELPTGFDQFTPHGATTAFRAGANGLDY